MQVMMNVGEILEKGEKGGWVVSSRARLARQLDL